MGEHNAWNSTVSFNQKLRQLGPTNLDKIEGLLCSSCSIDEWDDCEYTDTVDTWDRVTLGTNFNGGNEIDHLEDDQTHISRDYDHIQVGT